MLDKNGFMKNEVGTCHPAHVNDYKGKFTEDRVFVSNNLITSRSPGTALEFGLSLVELLIDQTTAIKLAKSLLVKRWWIMKYLLSNASINSISKFTSLELQSIGPSLCLH